ncbi:uncharacterized protein LOC128390156 [Panonychus citri]|uniref:uncharacterized protein LOC128390156 n=1 Tax=Panonychus citri TaxID=50023 RepID=UPI002307F057|nr:uncharacterized protein LOC128390156 [Panonychus citri]
MSYLYHGRSPTSRGQFPIIVTKAKNILPAKRTPSTSSSSRRSGLSKSKSSRLANIAILSQMNSHHHHHHHHLKSNSSSPSNGKGASNGSPTSEVYGSVNRNGSSASYGSSYRGSDKMYTRNNTRYKSNLNEEINRMYIEEGLKSGLLEKTKIKKPDETGNGSNGVGGYSETDGASDGTGRSNGKLIKGKSCSSKSKSQSKGKKRTSKELQTFIMRRILLCTNIVTLIIGITTLVIAGILDPQPLHRIGTTGGQISLASIYIIFVSLVGLYGSRLKNYRLLFIFAYTLLTGLVLRSFAALISVYIYHNANRLIFSMLFAIIEVILIFMGLAVAIDLKEEHIRKLTQSTSPNSFKV